MNELLLIGLIGVATLLVLSRKTKEKEEQSSINEAFIKGYELGVKQGEQNYLFRNVTPNMIRKAFDLDPIESKYDIDEYLKRVNGNDTNTDINFFDTENKLKEINGE